MPANIRIRIGDVILEAELFDTACAKEIRKKLPIDSKPNVWGDEFYFEIPVDMPLDGTRNALVKVGDIGYWPPGRALAIFFGPTPLSTGDAPVPVSEVNIVGKIIGDATLLRRAKKNGKLRVEVC